MAMASMWMLSLLLITWVAAAASQITGCPSDNSALGAALQGSVAAQPQLCVSNLLSSTVAPHTTVYQMIRVDRILRVSRIGIFAGPDNQPFAKGTGQAADLRSQDGSRKLQQLVADSSEEIVAGIESDSSESFETPHGCAVFLALYNSAGQRVAQGASVVLIGSAGPHEIAVTTTVTLSPGLYYLRIRTVGDANCQLAFQSATCGVSGVASCGLTITENDFGSNQVTIEASTALAFSTVVYIIVATPTSTITPSPTVSETATSIKSEILVTVTGELFEGGSAVGALIRLNHKPRGDVVILLDTPNTVVAPRKEFSINLDLITLTPGNWQYGKTVLLRAYDDLITDGTTHQPLVATVSEATFKNFPANPTSIPVAVHDNDGVDQRDVITAIFVYLLPDNSRVPVDFELILTTGNCNSTWVQLLRQPNGAAQITPQLRSPLTVTPSFYAIDHTNWDQLFQFTVCVDRTALASTKAETAATFTQPYTFTSDNDPTFNFVVNRDVVVQETGRATPPGKPQGPSTILEPSSSTAVTIVSKSDDDDDGLSGSDIAGIVIGSILGSLCLCFLLSLLFWLLCRRRGPKEEESIIEMRTPRSPPPPVAPAVVSHEIVEYDIIPIVPPPTPLLATAV